MPRVDATAILIHGIGSQKKDWSKAFRANMATELGDDFARIAVRDAFWAPRSSVRDLLRPSLTARATAPMGLGVEDETYNRAHMEFTRMLAQDAGATAADQGFGPKDVWDAITKTLRDAPDIAADVANYVARNGVRTALQFVLHEQLRLAQAAGAPILLVSHSQGTVISYDVLRQAGHTYPAVATWITMGSPLRKYFSFPLQWGRDQLGIQKDLRWLNLFDKKDIVGKDLAKVVNWPSPQPVDKQVDNQKNASNAHDHWGNPQVVKFVAQELRALISK